MSWKVLVSAPYMQPVIDKFRPIFAANDIEIVIPSVSERLSERELLQLVGDIDGAICGDDQFTEQVLRAAPRLKVISKWGTGIDSIDQETAAQLGIAVRNTPNAFSQPVADTVLGYVLSFARKLPWMDRRRTYMPDWHARRISASAFPKWFSNGWKTSYTLGDGNRLASTMAQAATNTLFVSGTANELIGTDERWGELWITNWTSGATAIPSVNGHSFFAEIPVLPGQTNTLHVAIPDMAGNMGYATTDVSAPSAGATPSASSYIYDEAGCLTNLNGASLEWDERYRLKSVDDTPSFVEYEYDVLNRRISRAEGGTTNYYVYNGNQVVADLDDTGALLRTYVWGMGIDNLLSFTDHTTSNTYYAIKDHQNTVIALTDENGAVVESYEYDAYGNTRVFDASGTELTQSAYGNRYCFQGREIDWTTGLYHFRARWYNPETGRWLSKDPIGIAGGLNQYVFCDNNPVNFTDPYGQSWSGFWDGVADALAVVGVVATVVALVATAPVVVAVATGVALSAGIHSLVADGLAEGIKGREDEAKGCEE